MLQGTGSDVGKSLMVAGLCRLARRRGVSVAPFKPQNMSNNAAACPGGGEIGRAQALQARAAGIPPTVEMNPVLLKPESDRRAQLVLHGRARGRDEAAAYMARRGTLLPEVLRAFRALSERHDLILVEGAGSPAEVNLRQGDIANMGFAQAAGVPVCLVADIDRGGVIASLVGTQAVLEAEDASRIAGFLINRFRGDPALFDAGVRTIEHRTGWRCFGVVPWLGSAARLPAEDAVVLERRPAPDDRLHVAVPLLSRISNFDDLDPLRAEPGVRVDFVPPGRPLPRSADAIILCGTKSTVGDLAMLTAEGWHHDIHAHVLAGGHLLGLCGGFQMMGGSVRDPTGSDGSVSSAIGLGLFDMETEMLPKKIVRSVQGRTEGMPGAGARVAGYEIHTGRSHGPALSAPLLRFDDGRLDGSVAAGGRILGTYMHGLFASDAFRRQWLESIRSGTASAADYEQSVEQALDDLADGMEAALDIDALLALAASVR
ncbi:cobyric acid synthase [Pacificimonas flava]|uniref:Cobyric acid synthase n=1 Tax=Pacificimonas flava TaxID=1234595 RepID=M2T8M8_9SPHN|nr:cobyric acid synthase [Pacificimonas flava]EMD82839.1 Cobyric acid synthase [Pacificimonas flava]